MKIDFNKTIRSILDLGGESYETRITRVIVKAGLVALFLIVVWKFLKG